MHAEHRRALAAGAQRQQPPSGPAASPRPRRTASAAAVGASKIDTTDISTPSRARTRLMSRVASSECPPSSKKLSSMPTVSWPSSSAKISQSAVSVPSRGARLGRRSNCRGAGSAFLSTFPLGVTGTVSIAV
ncbi:hypothetical protein LUW77_01010 [Streptomyces radiopugnans]|nr:hypothetical protein LUW77_01010 [Streptomyces radiopugnans]